jgi:hypothetical protein
MTIIIVHAKKRCCSLKPVHGHRRDPKRDLNPFSILFINAQFFNTSLFRSLSTLLSHGFPHELQFRLSYHVLGNIAPACPKGKAST